MSWQKLLEEWEAANDKIARRSQGSIWTPQELADWMGEWLLKKDPEKILDPAAGSGNLLQPFADREIVACEQDPALREILKSRFKKLRLYDDFWQMPTESFPAIIANPPYINSSLIENRVLIHKQLSRTLPRSSNLALLFYLGCWQRLQPGGRMIFLMPTEFMQIRSGAAFKKFLLEESGFLHIIDLSDPNLFGKDVASTACLVLAEKSKKNKSIYFSQHSGSAPFPEWKEQLQTGKRQSRKKADPDLRWTGKKRTPAQKTLGDFLDIRPGHITGDNSYFLLSLPEALSLGLEGSVSYIVLRTQNFNIFHRPAEIASLQKSSQRRFLLHIGTKPNKQEKLYLDRGLFQGKNLRPTLRNRDPWWQQNYEVGYDFLLPNFRRTRYRPLTYWDGDMTSCPYPSTQNMVWANKAEQKKSIYAWLLSDTGQAHLCQEERHAGRGLYTIRSGALKRVPAPDFDLLSSEWHKQMSASLDRLSLGQDVWAEINHLSLGPKKNAR